MTTTFYILLSARTDKGYENFGRFYIGDNADTAGIIFSKMKGSMEVKENCMLLMELMELRGGLPVNLQMLACTLSELGENCKIITTEVFKAVNLRASKT